VRVLAELKRRNVIRMAGLYLIGAWLLTQVAATLLPVFDAPGWVMKVLVGLLVAGFVAALVFSWVFELTPEGLKRDEDVTVAESIAPQTARRMDRVIIAMLLLALGYFSVDKFVITPGQMAGPSEAASITVASERAAGSESAAVSSSGNATKAIVRGVAVLPFDNLSPDPDNAYFTGGVYEEVLTKLSRIAELRVISRTSMERIAMDRLQVGAIGERLGVSHVLEGSVRRAGDLIRVTVQLIEAATDAHVWAENYDRKLDDVFAIQSEIALAIAGQLRISLTPQVQASLSEQPTQNQAAYALYLRALDERRSWRAAATFRATIDLLEPAVSADPEFLEARVLLADAYGRMAWLSADPDGRFAGLARQQVDDIVKRWPDHVRSEVAQGQLLYNLDRDYAQALPHFQAARVHLPNDAVVLSSEAGSYKRLDRHLEFLATARRLVEVDPESAIATFELIYALQANDLLDEALAEAERARLRFPDDEILDGAWAFMRLVVDQDMTPLLTRESIPQGNRYLADIARFVNGDIDALTRPMAGDGGHPGARLLLQLARTELLRLADRTVEAQAVADQARATLDDLLIVDGRLTPDDERYPSTNATAAAAFALLGEPKRAREYLTKASNSRSARIHGNSSSSTEYGSDRVFSDAERRLGDPEAAWLRLQPWAGRAIYLSHGELLAFQTYYDHLFGQSPSYRAYMAQIAGERR
jgi:TolB-like protein